MPFYVGDWLKAPDIRALTPAAKGLWIDMLCFMWESPERGVLKLGNKVIDRELLARMSGFARVLLDPLLDELLELGVYSVREDGAIFSRKMVKDEEIRQIRVNSGQKGGFARVFAQAKHQAKIKQNIEDEDEKIVCKKQQHTHNKEILINKWNLFAKDAGLSAVIALTRERSEKLTARAKFGFEDKFDEVLAAVKNQPFLLGANDRKWKVTFDWLIANDQNYIKVLEKQYLSTITSKGSKLPAPYVED